MTTQRILTAQRPLPISIVRFHTSAVVLLSSIRSLYYRTATGCSHIRCELQRGHSVALFFYRTFSVLLPLPVLLNPILAPQRRMKSSGPSALNRNLTSSPEPFPPSTFAHMSCPRQAQLLEIKLSGNPVAAAGFVRIAHYSTTEACICRYEASVSVERA